VALIVGVSVLVFDHNVTAMNAFGMLGTLAAFFTYSLARGWLVAT
jgi:hypothetical protein